jgi:hypothetical protein
MDEGYRAAKVAFRGEDNRITYFDIPRPGITVSLVSDEGAERFVPLGTVIAAGPDSTDSLLLRNTDGSAVLDVRGRVEPKAFGKSGVRRISMSALSAAAPHDQIRLLPHNRPELAQVLVSIAPTTSPAAFSVEHDRGRNKVVISLSCRQPIDAIKLVATDLVSATTIEAAVALSRWPVEIPHKDLIDGESDGSPEPRIRASISLANLSDGLWLGELFVRREGGDRWMALTNARGDQYLFGLLRPTPNLKASLNPADHNRIFLRVSDALNRCIALECWDSYGSRLEPLWRGVGSRLGGGTGGRSLLLQAAASPLPIEASPTWMPIHHPIELDPDLLAAEPASFRVFDNGDLDGGQELSAISITGQLTRLRDGIALIPLSLVFFQAFENFLVAARSDSVPLRGFSFHRYRDLLPRQADDRGAFWRPRDGRLSAPHHHWCLNRFVERVERIIPDGARNNGQRIPKATQLAFAAVPMGRDLAVGVQHHVTERLGLAQAIPSLFSLVARASRYQATSTLWQPLAGRTGRSVEDLLRDFGLLIRLGPELLGFYLLLWGLVRRSERP